MLAVTVELAVSWIVVVFVMEMAVEGREAAARE